MICTLLNLLQIILILFGTAVFFNLVFYPEDFIMKYLDELLKKIPIKLNPVLRAIASFIISLLIILGVFLLPDLGNCN